MALKKLKKETEDLLRAATDSRGAKSYAEWLGKSGADAVSAAHAATAKEARRAEIGYGAAGEALQRDGLADDGYAAYLRRAAKEAREESHRRIESERAAGQRSALGEYAAYLDGERRKKADRLVSLAEEISGGEYLSETADALIKESGAGETATALLKSRRHYLTPYERTAEGMAEIADVLDRLRRSGLPYQRAYEYCRLLGYGDALATRIARFAEEERSDVSLELEELFKG